MELLHTPKADLVRLMRENSLDIDEVVFLAASNKLNASDVRLYAPSVCDKMLNIMLRQAIARASEVSRKPGIETAEKTAHEIVA
jgi:hypothetical protein